MASQSKTFRAFRERHGSRCQSCGIEDAPLAVAHVVPIAKGGRHDIANLAILCRDCRHLLHGLLPSGLEFERFLSEILSTSPNYGNVRRETPLRTRSGTRLVADLTATRLLDGKGDRVLVEVKAWSSIRRGQVQRTIDQIRRYRDAGSFAAAALAFPGRLPEEDRAALRAAAIEVWDLDYVAGTFASEIEAQPLSGLRLLYLLVAKSDGRSSSDALIARLKNCDPGADWVTYQRVVADVFEFLFSPPLSAPIWESSDAPRTNRRDLILPNHAAEGFWRFLRETYSAHYIVVDAKNHKKGITKPQVLQIANYLKPHGTGMFGVIATRCGASANCRHTIVEQWAVYGKMIVLLSDQDIEAMLLAAGSTGSPEDVLGESIQKFRLSL